MTSWDHLDKDGGWFDCSSYTVTVVPGAHQWRLWIDRSDHPDPESIVITPHVFESPEEAASWARTFLASDDFYWHSHWGPRPSRVDIVSDTMY
jgi:hypothetical protein